MANTIVARPIVKYRRDFRGYMMAKNRSIVIAVTVQMEPVCIMFMIGYVIYILDFSIICK